MKTAGVIGGHDFLGCDITLKLLSENYRVKILIPEFPGNGKPVINTGIIASENLLFCRVDMQNQIQLKLFLEGCDCLIHSGMPHKLEFDSGEGSLYVPVISNTGNLLKCIKNVHQMGKIIFITSVAVFNSFDSDVASGAVQKVKRVPGVKNNFSQKALYHSDKLIDKILNDFSDSQIEILVVSPVVVINNALINRREATSEGLRYMFRNKLEQDKIFQKLIRRKLVKTMINVPDLPERVFNSVESYREDKQAHKLTENIDF